MRKLLYPLIILSILFSNVHLANAGHNKGPKQGGVKVGVLQCNVGSSFGFIFGSTKDVDCVFSRSKGKKEHYKGTINTLGIDIGYTSDGVMIWGVIALTTNVAPGSLGGTFVGAGAQASAIVGLGANALVLQGGNAASLALQPLSIEGFTGLNIAGGIRGLSLKHEHKHKH